MLIRFWGTRGSLPAPLTAARVREKLLAALEQAMEQAMGQILDTRERIEAFVDGGLDFATAGTYGGNTSCVEIDGGRGEYLPCDLGTGVREFGNRFLSTPHPGTRRRSSTFSCRTSTGITSWGSLCSRRPTCRDTGSSSTDATRSWSRLSGPSTRHSMSAILVGSASVAKRPKWY